MFKHKLYSYLLLTLGLFFALSAKANQTIEQADLIVFSYDRPLQLTALLESVALHVTGIKDVFIEYRSSNETYEEAYQQVKKEFSKAIFVRQDNSTVSTNFKPILCDIVERQTTQKYIVFATDDIVVCNTINISDCIRHLRTTKALGFYLRLGKNITHHYIQNNKKIPHPHFERTENSVLKWPFKQSKNPWGYHHTVDMTIYEKLYILPAIKSLAYKAPNTFEGKWNQLAPKKPFGLCYEHSKIVNFPLNLVQDECNNKHTNALSPEVLLKLFQNGGRMNIMALIGHKNNSVHDDFLPSFINQ